jgi:polysaccharide export outer membrane protein
MIEPPDILLIDTIRMIPRPPYRVQPLDILLLRVAEPLPNQPIEGTYTVAPDGTINLGYSYGLVRVGGLTLPQVERAIRMQLSRVLKEPQVAVGLAQFRGVQQARGEHLVRMDGTINLGTYGCVYVAGLTLMQAKVAIERHLSQYVLDPEVTVDVFAYNSKEYYIITDGAGYGQAVYRLPITGSDTVLRAISSIQGLPAVASKKRIWVARPAPADHSCFQVLPVDWKAITEGGATGTNYQLFPGDRIYVQSDALIRLDNAIAKILAPFERLMGFALLTATTIQAFHQPGEHRQVRLAGAGGGARPLPGARGSGRSGRQCRHGAVAAAGVARYARAFGVDPQCRGQQQPLIGRSRIERVKPPRLGEQARAERPIDPRSSILDPRSSAFPTAPAFPGLPQGVG